MRTLTYCGAGVLSPLTKDMSQPHAGPATRALSASPTLAAHRKRASSGAQRLPAAPRQATLPLLALARL